MYNESRTAWFAGRRRTPKKKKRPPFPSVSVTDCLPASQPTQNGDNPTLGRFTVGGRGAEYSPPVDASCVGLVGGEPTEVYVRRSHTRGRSPCISVSVSLCLGIPSIRPGPHRHARSLCVDTGQVLGASAVVLRWGQMRCGGVGVGEWGYISRRGFSSNASPLAPADVTFLLGLPGACGSIR